MSEQQYVLAVMTLGDGLEFYGPFSKRQTITRRGARGYAYENFPICNSTLLLHQILPLEGNRDVSLYRDLFVLVEGDIFRGFSVRGPYQSEDRASALSKGYETVVQLNVPEEIRPDIYVIHCTGPRGQSRFVGPYTDKDEAEEDACQLQRVLDCGTSIRKCRRYYEPDLRGQSKEDRPDGGNLFVILVGDVVEGWDLYGPYCTFRGHEKLMEKLSQKTGKDARRVVVKTMKQILEESCDE